MSTNKKTTGCYSFRIFFNTEFISLLLLFVNDTKLLRKATKLQLWLYYYFLNNNKLLSFFTMVMLLFFTNTKLLSKATELLLRLYYYSSLILSLLSKATELFTTKTLLLFQISCQFRDGGDPGQWELVPWLQKK